MNNNFNRKNIVLYALYWKAKKEYRLFRGDWTELLIVGTW